MTERNQEKPAGGNLVIVDYQDLINSVNKKEELEEKFASAFGLDGIGIIGMSFSYPKCSRICGKKD